MSTVNIENMGTEMVTAKKEIMSAGTKSFGETLVICFSKLIPN